MPCKLSALQGHDQRAFQVIDSVLEPSGDELQGTEAPLPILVRKPAFE